MSAKIQQLKQELSAQMPGVFRSAENLKKPQGFPTGLSQLDSFLEGGGLPRGGVSLLSGALGMGATSLWIESAAYALKEKKWVAWVSRDVPLMPVSLQQRGMNLGHFVAVESPLKKLDEETSVESDVADANKESIEAAMALESTPDLSLSLDTRPDLNQFPAAEIDGSIPSHDVTGPASSGVCGDINESYFVPDVPGVKPGSAVRKKKTQSQEKLAWLLQELMSSGLFDLIGCDLGEENLRVQDLRKLHAQARDANIALVFLSRRPPPKGASASLYSLVLKFERRRISIERALHRPTPQNLPRSVSYDRFTLHTADRIGTRSSSKGHLTEREPHSLSQTS